jgi:DNA-directed RNA polymerase II subunit RPB1
MTTEISQIKEIQFSISSPEDILKSSAAHINTATLYDTTSNNIPKTGGLFDTRLGVIDRQFRCKTCEQTHVNCPGHMGHIELAVPVYYEHFIVYVKGVLNCICLRCSKLLVNRNHPIIKNLMKNEPNNKKRFNLIKNLMKTKTCGGSTKEDDIHYTQGCGAILPNKIYSNQLDFVIAEYNKEDTSSDSKKKEKINNIISAANAISILKRISKEDAFILGFHEDWCLPHWLICSVLPVVPPSVRPSVKQYNNQRSEDDLTQRYNEIIKTNNHLKQKLASGDTNEDFIKHYTGLIQYYIITLIHNNIKGVPATMTKAGKKHMRSIEERLNGKGGRIRSNLMGKRVDFSARSVISPDPNLNIEELGVPIKIAMNLTFPEVVNKFNINKLYKLIQNRNNVYPGAKSYRSIKTGRTKYLDYTKETIELEYGDIVYRHLVDGDVVLFNRQPSLHKMSMMAHKIRVMKGSTFRLNVNVCKPYNADFDGDEMNMHVPQSIQTAIELKMIANVSKQIISPSSNSPIICPHQDNCLGLYKITDKDVYFTRKEVMNMLVDVTTFAGILPEPEINEPKRRRWTGKQLVSMALPHISMSMNSSKVVIKKGQLIKGQINKKVSNAIVHIIFNEYGFKKTREYLNNIQKIITKYLVRSGFSVGISDLIIHPDVKKINETIIIKTKEEIINMTKQVHLNIFEGISNNINKVYEARIKGLISKTSQKLEDLNTKNIDKNNRINYMIASGSKGSATNITQMTCILGQQMVNAARIPLSFDNRSLPHYSKYDNGVESRGFITNSFIDGLTPQEFFFHAMTGREGLIDTAVKTAKSGYIQRKLVKTMEDLKVNHDYSVRSSNGDIVQFVYGDDAFNSIYLEKQSFDLHFITEKTLKENYLLNIDDNWDKYIIKKVLSTYKKNSIISIAYETYNKKIIEVIKDIHLVYSKYEGANHKKVGLDITIYIPINFHRLFDNVKEIYNIKSNKSDITPLDIINTIHEITETCKINTQFNKLIEYMCYDKLSPNILIKKMHINKLALDYIKTSIISIYRKSLVDGGEMVGPVAAQSIGEISTQLTLNTFHYAGVGEKSNVTAGVPRLEELLNKQKPKEPVIKIFLREDIRHNKELVEDMKYNIELVNISDILDSVAIYLESANNYDNVLTEDKNIMKIYEVFSELDSNYKNVNSNPWLIRLEFNRRKILSKKISMDDIHLIIKYHIPNSNIIYADDNANKLIFRLKINFKSSVTSVDDDYNILIKHIDDIKNITIKGVNGIENVFLEENNSLIKQNGIVYNTLQEYYITTSGSNLFDILCKEFVDTTRTGSIDINEMYETFGIESARFVLEQQINNVFKFSGQSTSGRHVALLCDIMCNKGKIMAANRHGINQSNIGPLAKCSFEETTDQFKTASVFGVSDLIEGVSANIMVGQIPKCGTGDSEIILDEDKIKDYYSKKYKSTKSLVEDVKETDKQDNSNEIFEQDELINNDMFDISLIEGDNIEF